MKNHSCRQSSKLLTKPEFIRLPKTGSLCPYTGLSRTSLNELILPNEKNNNNPQVQSFSLKKKHQIRGIRLISYASLVDYLSTVAEEEMHQEVTNEGDCT